VVPRFILCRPAFASLRAFFWEVEAREARIPDNVSAPIAPRSRPSAETKQQSSAQVRRAVHGSRRSSKAGSGRVSDWCHPRSPHGAVAVYMHTKRKSCSMQRSARHGWPVHAWRSPQVQVGAVWCARASVHPPARLECVEDAGLGSARSADTFLGPHFSIWPASQVWCL
jgi:hypothetical protein